ncbi:hypothetical protein pb186bvf_019775 [Paramecium bursaria]
MDLNLKPRLLSSPPFKPGGNVFNDAGFIWIIFLFILKINKNQTIIFIQFQ